MKKRDIVKQELLKMIHCGAFAPGDKLPSIREIAQQYHCSITPVTEAYNELVTKQIIENRPCSGFYVSLNYKESPELWRHNTIRLNSVERYDSLECYFPGYSSNTVGGRDTIKTAFAPTASCSAWYPVSEVNASIGSVFRTPELRDVNRQNNIHDVVELRYEIMRWMLPCHCAVTVDELSIVGSVSLAIILALRACTRPGSLVAVESPGFTGFYFATHFLDCQVLPVRSDPVTGLDVHQFAAQLAAGEKPSCLLLSANFSNPTGALMPEENKLALTKLCAENGIPIIEDDCLGPIYFSGSRPLPLKSYDQDNVIYISGFGKTISPDIRLAWVAPGKYSNELALQKHLMVAYVNPSIQMGMANFLGNLAPYDYMFNFRNKILQAMREQVEIVNSCFPLRERLSLPQGGIYLWVELEEGINTKSLAERSAKEGISISPYNLFNAPPEMKNCFRLNSVSVPWDHKARSALLQLGEIASGMSK